MTVGSFGRLPEIIKRMSEAVGQYKGAPRVVREMAMHFLNVALAEKTLVNSTQDN